MKLGVAAYLLTSARSAETPVPVDDELAGALAEAGALLAGALLAGALPAGVLLAGAAVLLDDEHAASSTAAPTASPANAARAARGLRLLIPSMRPRIYVQGVHQTT